MAVCVVFLLHFGQWDLALLLFVSLLVYGFVTIRITLWRRKFREMSNKKDNEIHERASDTLINFETVKVLEMKYIYLCICAVESGVDVLYGLVFVRRRGATMRCTGPCPLSLNKPDDNTHTPQSTQAFTNEQYEKARFQEAVRAYQGYSVTTQASLSLLNGIQQFIVQGCTVGALILTARRVSQTCGVGLWFYN